jgi:hypothetical protein
MTNFISKKDCLLYLNSGLLNLTGGMEDQNSSEAYHPFCEYLKFRP